MKSFFSHDLSLKFRFIVAIFFAVVIIAADSRSGTFNQIRIYLDTAISPLYFLSNAPRELLDKISKIFTSRNKLEVENRVLREALLLKNSKLLTYWHYKQENSHLRNLLNSPLHHGERTMATQVISTITNPYSDQIVIDKGSVNGVYEGQVVINDKGIVGQVIAVSKFTSRVLLICDVTHALPIRVLRNDICVIAAGIGCFDELELKQLPINIDVQIGDLLVTSGLGGRFPEGYPVAIVSYIKRDVSHAYTLIRARPTAVLNRLHYLLLLWNDDTIDKNPTVQEEVRLILKEQLFKSSTNISFVKSTKSYY